MNTASITAMFGWPPRWLAVALASLIMLLAALPESWQTAGYFTAQAFQQGQWWLLFSSQWLHLNFSHALFNAVAVWLVIAALPGSPSNKQISCCVLSCQLSIALYLAVFPSTYSYYAGFSGVLYGLLLWGGVAYWRFNRWLAVAVIVFVAGKLLFDSLGSGADDPVAWLGARSAVEVHVAGVAGAVVFVLSSAVRAACSKSSVA